MKNKRGFVFVETIVTTVVLLSALLFIYGTYSSMIREEKKRLYFDDISYIYKTQIIASILEENIDHRFLEVVSRSDIFLSVFNYGSKIFKEGSNGAEELKAARDLYNFGQVFYLSKGKIIDLKDCLRGKSSQQCTDTINRIEGYGDTNFREYLEKLDISDDKIEQALTEKSESSSGILIVLYYKAKNGSNKVNYGTYNECVVDEYKNKYGETVTKYSQVNSQYKSYFTMQCENAYYISWAYFNANDVPTS